MTSQSGSSPSWPSKGATTSARLATWTISMTTMMNVVEYACDFVLRLHSTTLAIQSLVKTLTRRAVEFQYYCPTRAWRTFKGGDSDQSLRLQDLSNDRIPNYSLNLGVTGHATVLPINLSKAKHLPFGSNMCW